MNNDKIVRRPEDMRETFMAMFDRIDPVIDAIDGAFDNGEEISVKAFKVRVDGIMSEYTCQPDAGLTKEQTEELLSDFAELQTLFGNLITSVISKAKILHKYGSFNH